MPVNTPVSSERGAPPLWRQLQAAAAVLAAIRSGVSGTAALTRVESGLRPGVQALVFQALRSLARAENLRRQLAPRPPPPRVDALLCLALALGWRSEDAPYEVFTLVNQAVEAAKREASTQAQASFVNACLRRFLRERDALVARSDKDPVVQWNHPAWWIKRLQKDHPTQWQGVLRANNQQAPLHLRPNACRNTQAVYLERLQVAGIDAVAIGHIGGIESGGIRLVRAVPVQQLPGFDAGDVSVQDAAAQLAAPFLLGGLAPGAADATPLRILDACAAPGGKTAHLLELANAQMPVQIPVQVLALEIDRERSLRIADTMQRLGLQAQVTVGDAAQPAAWWDGQLFDAILLDAPCTASGIVRRHPDIPWLRQESDVAQLSAVQAHLLRSLWPLLKPGGRLLYCTCSVFRAEGSEQVQTFLAHNTDARMLPSTGHLLPQFGAKGEGVPDNPMGDHDGFFYALLEKRVG